MGWRTPTGHYDPDGQWTDETNAYDSNTSTPAGNDISPTSWGNFLELNIGSILCSGGQFYAWNGGELSVNQIDLDFYYDGSWHDCYQGSFTDRSWVQKGISPNKYVTKARIRFYNSGASPSGSSFYEFQFYEVVITAPTVTTQACTDITGYSAKGNGTITSTGGATVTTRGFCYMVGTSGDPTTANSKVYDTGSFGTGAYSKTIPNLSPSTNYRVRAYAINSEGTSYGATVQLTTDSPPTVTTQASTDVTHNSATGNGNITATGGENANERGFEYKEGTEGEVLKVYDTGSFGTGVFNKGITDLKPGTLYYVRAYAKNSAGTGYGDWVSFTTDKINPTVTTQDATEVSQNHVKGKGNITSTGGENCSERGFQYGLTKDPTWTKKETGSYEAGAFNLTIENLQANTQYWYRAYAKNTVDPFYGYGEWVQFQTSATGTVPTGTKVSICSDYSGHTYKLNSAFTDDGETYESFFVLSTDLAQKQGLHIYKRLEDIFSYFAKKESGTAKIYIKQDSEAEWNYAGEVSMVGDEDIVVPHLPVDFLAKHYLIKFVFVSDFEYIGSIFESIPIGVR